MMGVKRLYLQLRMQSRQQEEPKIQLTATSVHCLTFLEYSS